MALVLPEGLDFTTGEGSPRVPLNIQLQEQC